MYSIENQTALNKFIRKHRCDPLAPGCMLDTQVESISKLIDAGDTGTQWMIYLVSRQQGRVRMRTFCIHLGEMYV
jgi:hypothetical protein